MLRAHHCLRCGDPMPLGRRVDRKYCRASCRTSAYRTRRIQTTPRKGARRGPKQQTNEPLPPELVLALRQIPPAVLTTLADWFGEHASSEQLTAARQRITELEQQVQRVRSEQVVQQEAHRRDTERQQADESAQRAREQKAREADSRQRTDATSRQLTELQSAVRRLETQLAERTAELQRERAEHRNIRNVANEQNRDFGIQIRQAREEADRARADAEELRGQAYAMQTWCATMQERLTAFEQDARERHQAHEQTRSPAERAPKVVRRETQPKRHPRATARDTTTPSRSQPPPEPTSGYYVRDDPFLALMMEYVLLRDELALQSIPWEGEKQRLPDRMETTIEAHAFRLANKKRHEFFNSPDRGTTFQPAWIYYGQRLDEASEAMLRAEVSLAIKRIKKKLGCST